MDSLKAAEFASNLAQYYQDLADKTEDFLYVNRRKISKVQEHDLSSQFNQLLSYSNKFAALSDGIAFTGADEYFQKVLDANTQITDALNTMKTVDKVINITAGVIGLAENLVTENGGGILNSLETIAQNIKA
jgi:hypothetical protein